MQKLLAIFAGISMFTCLSSSASAAGAVVAKINGKTITLEEFNKRYLENKKYFQLNTPSKEVVLDEMVKRELGIQEAKKMGLDQDPEVIDKMNTVLYHSLLEKKLSKQFEEINISDAEAKSYYEKFPELRTSHIFVKVDAGASKEQESEARAKIKKIMDEHVKPGKMSFAEVAQKYSEGIAAPMGGDIDFQTKDKLDPAYFDAAMKLKTPGKVSDIVRSAFGFHIIKLTAVRAWKDTDQAKVKRIIFEDRRKELFDKYMRELRAKAKVTVDTSALKD